MYLVQIDLEEVYFNGVLIGVVSIDSNDFIQNKEKVLLDPIKEGYKKEYFDRLATAGLITKKESDDTKEKISLATQN